MDTDLIAEQTRRAVVTRLQLATLIADSYTKEELKVQLVLAGESSPVPLPQAKVDWDGNLMLVVVEVILAAERHTGGCNSLIRLLGNSRPDREDWKRLLADTGVKEVVADTATGGSDSHSPRPARLIETSPDEQQVRGWLPAGHVVVAYFAGFATFWLCGLVGTLAITGESESARYVTKLEYTGRPAAISACVPTEFEKSEVGDWVVGVARFIVTQPTPSALVEVVPPKERTWRAVRILTKPGKPPECWPRSESVASQADGLLPLPPCGDGEQVELLIAVIAPDAKSKPSSASPVLVWLKPVPIPTRP